MKRLIVLCLLLSGLNAAGQNIVADFARTLEKGCASFSYAYSMTGNVPLSGSGKITLQDNAFTMDGDGLQVWCDGTTRWTVDTVAEECYIESVTERELDYEANPALLVGSVDKAFTLKKTSTATFNSQKVTEAVLEPISKEGNISGVSLMLVSASKPAGLLVRLTDGNTITVVVKDFAVSGSVPVKDFTFNTKKLDKNYIVTDLR